MREVTDFAGDSVVLFRRNQNHPRGYVFPEIRHDPDRKIPAMGCYKGQGPLKKMRVGVSDPPLMGAGHRMGTYKLNMPPPPAAGPAHQKTFDASRVGDKGSRRCEAVDPFEKIF